MAKGYILSIGGVDLTDYIAYGDMTVTEEPVFEEAETKEQMYAAAESTVLFTAVSGRKIYDTPTGDPPSSAESYTVNSQRKLIGKKVSISAAARLVPSAVASAVFVVISAAANSDDNGIEIDYAAPAHTKAKFECPSVTSEISAETEQDTLYDISITANCPLIRFGGA